VARIKSGQWPVLKINNSLEAKDVLPNKPNASRRNHPPDSDGMVPSAAAVTSFAANVFHSIAAGGAMAVQCAFFVPGDLDL